MNDIENVHEFITRLNDRVLTETGFFVEGSLTLLRADSPFEPVGDIHVDFSTEDGGTWEIFFQPAD